MVPKVSKRVAIYARVSTRKGQDTENQVRALREVAEQRGWKIVEVYTDKGISGAKGRDKRPAFDKLCKDATRGKFDVVAAWALDRVGRDLSHLLAFVKDMQALGVDLYLHQQAMDTTTPTGKVMFAVVGAFAEFERDMLLERMAAARAKAEAEGKQIGRPKVAPEVERQVLALRKQGYGMLKIAGIVGVGSGTVQRIVREQAA